MLCAFSCVGPVGAALGFAVQRAAGHGLEGAMLALTAGTFVYVGATEVVGEEFETPHRAVRLRRAAALGAGVLVILVLGRYAKRMESLVH